MLLEIKTRVITEEKRDTKITDCNELNGKEDVTKIDYISDEAPSAEMMEYALITYKKYIFKVDKELKIIEQIKDDTKTEDIDISKNDSLIGKVSQINTGGVQNIEVNGVTYTANVIVENNDLILDGQKQVNGAVLSQLQENEITKNTYEFGDKQTDVAKLDVEGNVQDAQNMIILKVNGNLTINENVTVTTCKNDDGYGGPKGFLIYCTETLTNNGTIDMTARGAIAEGQNVYLWKNANENYEFVPEIGAKGGDSVTTTYEKPGNSGENGAQRQTGGGGSGGAYRWSSGQATSGSGGNGTSYSGGSRRWRNHCKRLLFRRRITIK